MGALGQLIPLIVLVLVAGVVAYFGFQIYLYANELADRGVRKMEKKNVVFTKDGMKVGVKEVRDEEYMDRTQSLFVKAWGLTSFPAYKSRLGWNKEAQPSKPARKASSSSKATSSGAQAR